MTCARGSLQCPLLRIFDSNSTPTHVLPPRSESQGMAANKAKLEFVKLYYEFPSKVLYSDTRA